MIIDRLTNASSCGLLTPRLAAALDYLRNSDFAATGPGRYDIDGSAVYALVSEYVTKPLGEAKWEAHRRYIDVQHVASGEERIGWAPLATMAAGAYDEAKDFVPLTGDGDFLTVRQGMFVVLFPHDAHMPGVRLAGPAAVKKVVVKVAVA